MSHTSNDPKDGAIPMGETAGPAVSPAPGASSTAPAHQKSLVEEAQEAKARVEGEAHAAMTEAHTRTAGALDEAKAEAGKLAEQARRRAELAADEYKARAADQGQSMAARLRAAGHEFGDGSLPDRYVGRMADSLSDAADAFARKDLGTLIADTAGLARRNPAAFVGGAALLGFAIARFLKASSREPDYYTADPYEPGYAGAAARPDGMPPRTPMASPAIRRTEY